MKCFLVKVNVFVPQQSLQLSYSQSTIHQMAPSHGTFVGCHTTSHVSPHQRNQDKLSDQATPARKDNNNQSKLIFFTIHQKLVNCDILVSNLPNKWFAFSIFNEYSFLQPFIKWPV